MNWMTCTTCTNIVLVNETGTCLGCQRGFCGQPQEDDCDAVTKQELKRIEEEKHNADEVRRAKKISAREQTSNGCKVGKRDAKGQKASKKGKEKEEECLKTTPTSSFARLQSSLQSLLKK